LYNIILDIDPFDNDAVASEPEPPPVVDPVKNGVVLINEGQFFPDIEEQVRALVEKEHKRVFICGLDGDFERKPIGQLQNLFPLCDEIIKLKSLCSICRDGTPGIFSFRITNEVDQVVIGSSNYIPLCRKCYNSEAEKKEQNSKMPRDLQ
jgi:thymidine kinase